MGLHGAGLSRGGAAGQDGYRKAGRVGAAGRVVVATGPQDLSSQLLDGAQRKRAGEGPRVHPHCADPAGDQLSDPEFTARMVLGSSFTCAKPTCAHPHLHSPTVQVTCMHPAKSAGP